MLLQQKLHRAIELARERLAQREPQGLADTKAADET
jgi:hypothetical protein